MANYKKILSISVSEEVYRIVKEKGNVSSYINELVLKTYYKKDDLPKEIKDSNTKDADNYYKVKL